MECHDKNPGDFTVYKYTNHMPYSGLGKYKMCINLLNDYGTNKSLI